MPKDSRLFAKIQAARSYSAHGNYSNAATAFADAVPFISDAWEAEYLFAHWQQLFQNALYNKPNNDPISLGYTAKLLEYRTILQSLYNQNQPLWLKHIAGAFLGDYYMRDKDFQSASAVYDYLASQKLTDPKSAKRALMALVILKHRGQNDYDAAFSVYETIELYYPHSTASIFAKIDLGLPLDSLDLATINALPQSYQKDDSKSSVYATSVQLFPAYPNPFNPSTVIEYSLPSEMPVTLTVYASLGEAVQVLENGLRGAGMHSVDFTAPASLPSGVYLYELRTPQGTLQGRMMLAK